MRDQANQPLPVIEYAPPLPPRRMLRWIGRGAVVLICAVAGALLGRAVAPQRFTAVAYVQVTDTTTMNPQSVVALQQLHADGLTSTTTLNTASATMAGPRKLATAEMRMRVLAQPIPQSRLISLAYTDSDPSVAAAAAAAIVNAYCSGQAAAAIATMPSVPMWGRYNRLFLMAGAVIGAVAGLLFILLRPTRPGASLL